MDNAAEPMDTDHPAEASAAGAAALAPDSPPAPPPTSTSPHFNAEGCQTEGSAAVPEQEARQSLALAARTYSTDLIVPPPPLLSTLNGSSAAQEAAVQAGASSAARLGVAGGQTEMQDSPDDDPGLAGHAGEEEEPQLVTVDHSAKPLSSGVHVYTWGRGEAGQLGNGQPSAGAALPQPVPGLAAHGVVALACNLLNGAALTAEGDLYTWGANDSGQLGIKALEAAAEPQRVAALDAVQLSDVAVGGSHVIALANEGTTMYCWGSGDFGQLGLGTSAIEVRLPRTAKQPRPDVRWSRVAAGARHSLALSSSGDVYAFGAGDQGALGVGDQGGAPALAPTYVSRLWAVGVTQVSCGDSHSLALCVDGRLFAWGRNRYGQLGLGDTNNALLPVRVALPDGCRLEGAACGGDHSAAVAGDGRLWTWGRGRWGATGHGSTDDVLLPRWVDVLSGERVVQVAAGARHTLALCASNTLWACGAGDDGQLGTGSSKAQLCPTRVAALPAGARLLFAAAGGDHSAVVVQAGLAAEAGTPGLDPRYGSTTRPMQPPPLQALAADAAADPGDVRALARLRRVVEDVFQSPAFLRQAFSIQAAQEMAIVPVGPRAVVAAASGGAAEPGAADRAGGDAHEEAAAVAAAARAAEATVALPAARGPPARAVGGGGGGGAGSAAAEPASVAAAASIGGVDAAGESGIVAGGVAQTGGGGGSGRGEAGDGGEGAGGDDGGGPGLDIKAITSTYERLLKIYNPELLRALAGACGRLLDGMQRALQHGSGVEQSDFLHALFILLFNPLNGSDAVGGGGALVAKIAAVVAGLATESQQVLEVWVSRLVGETLGARVVRPIQRYLSSLGNQFRVGAARQQVLMTGNLLGHLYRANERRGAAATIPSAEFYNKEISDAADLQEDYIRWLQLLDRSGALARGMPAPASLPLASLCQLPFLLTPEAKSKVLHVEAALQKQRAFQHSHLQALFSGLHPSLVGGAGFLDLRVRREAVLEDALNQIVSRPRDLKKPLRVTFISAGLPEEGLDEGGVTKEFFQLLSRDLFNVNFGMFTFQEDTRTYWFNPTSIESEVEFQLVGAALGLAIYNGVLLDAHLPLVTYKKLLGIRPTFADLEDAFPALAAGLRQLLQYSGDVESTFCATFATEYEYYGEMRTHELKPGGADIAVSESNREEYVRLLTEWKLEGSIKTQFDAFRSGFHSVCGGPALTLFRYNELELLVCGLPHLDFEQLQAAARYEGGYSAGHPAVQAFWACVQGLSLEHKKRFLLFVTGSDRAPVGGLSQLSLLIQRSGPDSDRLPTSHTCFNTLLLPEYSSVQKMQAKLLAAINNAQGFGLQ